MLSMIYCFRHGSIFRGACVVGLGPLFEGCDVDDGTDVRFGLNKVVCPLFGDLVVTHRTRTGLLAFILDMISLGALVGFGQSFGALLGRVVLKRWVLWK